MKSSSLSASRAVVAVRVVDVANLGHERLERRPQRRDPVDRERAHRRAVVGDVPGDRLVAVRAAAGARGDRIVPGLRLAQRLACVLLAAGGVVLPGELPCRLDGLRATRDEEDAVEVAGRERCKLRRELDRLRMRVRPVGVERQLAHLLERRLADLLAVAVADVDREQSGERVEVALAVRIPEVAPVARTMIGTSCPVPELVPKPPIRVKCIHRWSRASCCRSVVLVTRRLRGARGAPESRSSGARPRPRRRRGGACADPRGRCRS